jgi:hypothetical protein
MVASNWQGAAMVKITAIEDGLGTRSGKSDQRRGIIIAPIMRGIIVYIWAIFHHELCKKNTNQQAPLGTLFFNDLRLTPFLLFSRLNLIKEKKISA